MSDLGNDGEEYSHYHQNGQGADGGLASAFFAGQDIKMFSVNPVSNVGQNMGMTVGVNNQQKLSQ